MASEGPRATVIVAVLNRPRAAVKKNAAPLRRARACPSPGYRARGEIAGETRSDARMASEGPRATVIVAVLSRPRATLKKNAFPYRRVRACPSPCIWLSDCITSVGQDRLILTRSGAGAPELQRWARCAPLAFLSVFALPQGGHL